MHERVCRWFKAWSTRCKVEPSTVVEVSARRWMNVTLGANNVRSSGKQSRWQARDRTFGSCGMTQLPTHLHEAEVGTVTSSLQLSRRK